MVGNPLFLSLGSEAPNFRGENAELRSYVMAKLLWGTRVDTNQLVDEFLDGVYGKAAPAMRAYFRAAPHVIRAPRTPTRRSGPTRCVVPPVTTA